MKIIGLTGGIATGKSTVGRLLERRHGIPVIDADQVSREVVAPGTEGLASLVEAFGPEILTADGALDRPAMRARIIADPEARGTLESITHPAIARSIGRQVSVLATAGHPLAAVEAALMVETGSYKGYSEVMVVTCTPEHQLERLMARDGITEEAAKAMVATQLPLADKERAATILVRNDGDAAALARRVDDIVAHLRRKTWL